MLRHYSQVSLIRCEMSKLVNAHLPCDDCGSSDALAEYEDSTYCFSCGRARNKRTEKSFFDKPEGLENNSNTSLQLPPNSTARLSPAALKWLLTYQVFEDICKDYNIRYDYRSNRVILPSYSSDGTLMFYQARALSKEDQPKYLSVGSKQSLFWSKGPYDNKTTIVLVEDMLSAIRVGKVVQTVSLIGTSLNKEKLLHLSQDYAIMIVWMDGDKEGQRAAKKLVKQLSLLTSNVFNVTTRQDPKCLFESDIRKELAPYLS